MSPSESEWSMSGALTIEKCALEVKPVLQATVYSHLQNRLRPLSPKKFRAQTTSAIFSANTRFVFVILCTLQYRPQRNRLHPSGAREELCSTAGTGL
jgi:hypothetical protein